MQPATAPDLLIDGLDEKLMEQAQARLNRLTKPPGSLGRLESLAKQIVGMTRRLKPSVARKVIITMAADHGVVEEGVSAFPQAVTAQMVLNFLRGGAGINVLARHAGARVIVVDMGVAQQLPRHPELIIAKAGMGTRNFAREAAMTREQAAATIETGMRIANSAFEQGAEILGCGEMGIGNTTAASAIAAAVTGASIEQVTGHGTGIDAATHQRKIAVIRRALDVNLPDAADGLDVLAKVGGFEIGGLAGVMLASAAAHKPVVIDGFISTAAALIAAALKPAAKAYMIASHLSQEPGHRIMLRHLGLEPVLDLNLRLGEGTGAALAMPVVEAACRIFNEMATFEEAGVSEKA